MIFRYPRGCWDAKKVGKIKFCQRKNQKTEIYSSNDIWGFLVLKVFFQPICVMNIPNGLKRNFLAAKILKIHAVEKKCQIGKF